jgi:hypothetical protein
MENNELEFSRYDLGLVFIKVANYLGYPKALGGALDSLRAADEELYEKFLKEALDYTALELDRLAHNEREVK